jgi:hypothetical protein
MELIDPVVQCAISFISNPTHTLKTFSPDRKIIHPEFRIFYSSKLNLEFRGFEQTMLGGERSLLARVNRLYVNESLHCGVTRTDDILSPDTISINQISCIERDDPSCLGEDDLIRVVDLE